MAQTAAQKAQHVRKEALREFLSKQKLVEHVFELSKKIEQLGVTKSALNELKEEDQQEVDVALIDALANAAEFDLKKYKTSADINLKLINKYLPDMKHVESDNTHSLDDETVEKITRHIVDPRPERS